MASSKKKEPVLKISAMTTTAFVILVITLIIAQTWWSIHQERKFTLATANKDSLLNVRILEEHANRVLQDVSQTLLASVEELKLKSDSALQDEASVRAILSHQRRDSQFLYSLSLIDEKGLMWASSLRFPFERVNVSSQDQIAYLSSNDSFGKKNVVVGSSFLSPKTKQLLLPLARNIHTSNGKLIGQLQADIRLLYFQEFYGRMVKNAGADIFLLDRNGKVIIRALSGSGAVSKEVDREVIEGVKLSVEENGRLEKTLISESNNTAYTSLKMGDFPLVIVYGRDLNTVLSAWKKSKDEKIALAFFAILLTIILAYLLYKKVQTLQISKEKLTESERRYRMLFEDAQDGILLINKEFHFVDANQNALEMLALDAKAELQSLDISEFSADFKYTQPTTAAKKAEQIKKFVIGAFKGKVQKFEWISHRRGKDWHSEVNLSRVTLNGESMVFCVMRDISQRKHAERLLQGQNQLLQLIGSNESLESIMIDTCHFVEKNNPHWHCGVQLLSADQKIFTQVIGHHFPEILKRQMIDAPVCQGNGIWSEAVMEMVPVWITEIARSPSMKLITQRKLLSNYAAVGSWPIMGKTDALLGAFTLFSESGVELNNKEQSLISIATDIASIAIEGKRAEEKAIRLAHYDEITHLPNRFLFNQYLTRALLHSSKYKKRLAVLFIDLDNFKSINDVFDHKMGDKVLINLSKKMNDQMGSSDTIARVGGDEFMVLMEDFNATRDVTYIADCLLDVASLPFKINDQEMQLSASIGIAMYPNDGVDSQDLMKNAEMAMYRAKQSGRGNYQFYAAEMNANTLKRLESEALLRQALDRHEFVVYFQPKISVETGRIVGAEALVRWNHPEQGLVFPSDFIGLAEDAGYIGRIGMQVLEKTCRDIASFHQASKDFGRIAINLSGAQFVEKNIVSKLIKVLHFWEVPTSMIEFEITESMVMQNIELAIQHMDELIAAGFTLSIDDFGTGYSSLAYLKRFPVNSVKIDRSFVKDMHDDSSDKAIVLAIVAMAHSLDLKVVAEGVEYEHQLRTLQDCLCDEYQGYFFSQAVPSAKFIELLKKDALLVDTTP